MSDIAIHIESLSKEYRIDPNTGISGNRTLQEDVLDLLRAPFRHGEQRDRKEVVHALSDVTLDVHEGEVLGLIGRNGNGKSTLLKILSRITEPTSGYAELFGRVGSLLEVGTGFHSELTGRENIYLSGSILGMRKKEIDRKFDDIVDFSGVERYIDTPVKRYSSGMAVRLAFAVAAHLEPEILLVDEVLAVGDAAFQKKSMGKMSEVARGGRTVIFVSHNMGAVKSMCTRAAWLNNGKLAADGPVDEVVQAYLLASNESIEGETRIAERTDRAGNGRLRFTGFQLRNLQGELVTSAVAGDPLELVLSYRTDGSAISSAMILLWLRDPFGKGLLALNTGLNGQDLENLPPEGKIICRIPRFPLRMGRYYLDLGADIQGVKADRLMRAAVVDVIGGTFYPTGKEPHHPNDGDMLCEHQWYQDGQEG